MIKSEPEYVKEFLEQIPKFSKIGKSAVNYSLQNIRQFCTSIGNPHKKLSAIHVAGTNGKGSVCRMLSSMLQTMGKKVGLFTSPHLYEFNERIRINSHPVEYGELAAFIRQHSQKAHAHHLSYFEVSTAMAFWIFNSNNVDTAILETGLGGRLDATNIVDPPVSVITSIGRDHEDILGKGIKQIAKEKSGIIKKNRHVVVGNLPRTALDVVKKKAREESASLHQIPDFNFNSGKQELTFESSGGVKNFMIPFKAPIQAHNVTLAYTVLQQYCTAQLCQLDDQAVQNGLDAYNYRFPQTACFEKLNPKLNWYFDGAHNADALASLKVTISQRAPIEQWTLVFTVMHDKLNSELIHHLLGFKKIYYYPSTSKRTAPINTVTKLLPKAKRFPLKAEEQIKSGFVHKQKTQLVLFTGSFYFYKQIRGWVDHIISEK